jgi:uridine kinase
MTRPHLIGIAGASCSGKTTLAERLAAELGPSDTRCIGLDSYYYDMTGVAHDVIDHHNFDDPASLESALLFEQVRALVAGRAIDKPVYDLKTHTRTATTEHIEPAPFIIIEGLFTLYWPEVREHITTSVFIDATHDVCLDRRIRRDRNKRGRSRDEVTRRYREMVAPMYDRYVLPTRAFAGIVVDGHGSIDRAAERILLRIRARE